MRYPGPCRTQLIRGAVLRHPTRGTCVWNRPVLSLGTEMRGHGTAYALPDLMLASRTTAFRCLALHHRPAPVSVQC